MSDQRYEADGTLSRTRSARRAALADAVAEIAALEHAAIEPYRSAYKKAKEHVLAMIEAQ